IALTTQQLLALSLPPELVVSAAAGSGKTEVLVQRVLDGALIHGIPLDRMLIVTFTRSAAAELRERIRRGLNSSIDAGTASRHAEAHDTGTGARASAAMIRLQLAALERAQISTIHSFCLNVVSRFGYLHGLSAARILPDDEARLLRHEVCGELVLLRLSDPPPELHDAALAWGGPDGVGLDDLSGARSSRGLRDLVLRLHDFRRSLPDPRAWFTEMVDTPPLDPEHSDSEHPLVMAALQTLRDWCRDFAAASSELAQQLHDAGTGVNAARLLTRRCDALDRLQRCRDWGELPAAFVALDESLPLPYPPKSLLAGYTRDVEVDELKTQISDVAKSGQDVAKKLRHFYSQPWRDVALRENETHGRLVAVWQLAEEFEQLYAARKQEFGAVDYADLEAGALRLMLDADAGVADELRSELDFVLVDEYQDSSPIQDAIVELITPGSPKSRFIVGDLKQSIYAFRLAEPSLFSRHIARLDATDAGGSALKLTDNFRSREKLVAAINHIFDGLLCEELGGEDYTQNRLSAAVNYRALCGDGFTEDRPARLHLVEVEKGRLRSSSSDEGDSAEDDSAEDDAAESVSFDPQYARVAAILREMYNGGQQVYDKQLGQARPAKWGDMAVLLRSSRGRVEALRRELDRAGIRSYAPGRSGFYERPEIGDALSLLAVVDNPRQDIPLATVLSGPAVGLSPADLARIVIGSSATLAKDIDPAYGAGDLWGKVEHYLEHGADETLRAKLAEFTARLEGWRDASRSETLDRLLQMLVHDSGLTAAAAALKNGPQRLANLAALAERARQFGQARQGLSAFLEYISASRRAAGDSGEAALLTERQDVVRVLTVHQAKGLEFPIVVVPDLH
ncbi:MAG: UvrD-helicase domain-containing protein, partial [bacterium]|nr:UvrD-helicase domain-containing protein [bacterium]